MIPLKTLQQLAREHGTPLFVVDHDELRRNYQTFKKYLPRASNPIMPSRLTQIRAL